MFAYSRSRTVGHFCSEQVQAGGNVQSAKARRSGVYIAQLHGAQYIFEICAIILPANHFLVTRN